MKVVAIGEALIDLLSSQCLQHGSSSNEVFTKFAGGAPANVAVAVAKLGGKSYLLGKVGRDQFGHFLIDALKRYGVSTDYVGFSETGKTALAFINLDKNGERAFEFYDDNAAHNDIQFSDFLAVFSEQPKVISLCSAMLANPELHKCSMDAIYRFNQEGSIICLDINYRPAFWKASDSAADIISDAAEQVDIVKASREELITLFGIEQIEAVVKQWINKGVSLVMITDGGNAVSFTTANFNGIYPAPKTNAVDTTAAGDAFVGGFLYRLAQENSSTSTFFEWVANFEYVLKAINFATKCGAHTTTQFGAFDSLPYQTDIEGKNVHREPVQ